MVYLLLDILVRALILCPVILLWNIAIIWQMNAMEQKFTADMCHPAWKGHCFLKFHSRNDKEFEYLCAILQNCKTY